MNTSKHFEFPQLTTGVDERPSNPLELATKHSRLGLPRQINIPETSIYYNLEVSARRFPAKTAIQFFSSATRYDTLLRDVDNIAGWLQTQGVQQGDRVAIFSQNCPQFIAAYFAILRADAVFVPVNAMLLQDELRHILTDSGARVAFVAQELFPIAGPLLEEGLLSHVVVHAYGDALTNVTLDITVPDWVQKPSSTQALPEGAVRWAAALLAGKTPSAHLSSPDDLCMLPYTSGTTGAPKACMHTHRTAMASFVGSTIWRRCNSETTFLAVAPLFHLLGLQNNVNAAIYLGGTVVLMPRWDSETAAILIERYRISFWAALPAMLVDFFAQPGIEARDLSSLAMVTGGGAATPDSINHLLKERYSLDYIEGYGLTETATFLCANPVHAPKRVCLGVPTFGVDLRIIDPETLEPVAQGEVGEIIAHGSQVMRGYWNSPEANAQSFMIMDGKRFFRTGDLGCIDADGYVFMRDRLKRMINAAGYKVWPAEVEATLNSHPDIHEACVIASQDAKRGETVKAIVSLKPGRPSNPETLLAWCRANMATYKAPRLIEIVEALPKSPTGKIAWRELQEAEHVRGRDNATPSFI